MFPDFSSGTLAKPIKPSTSAQHRVTPQVLTEQHPHQPEALKKYAEGRKKPIARMYVLHVWVICTC